MRNIVLIGFMGSGKTTIAARLANRLNMRYVSTDDLIEKKEGRTINEIFTKSGEGYFRDVESQIVGEVSAMENCVVDAGGGVVIHDENIDLLKTTGVVICLSADPETIMERTNKYKHRPLLNVEDPKRKIRDLLAKRAPLYAKADHTIDTGNLTIAQAVDNIIGIMKADEGQKDGGAT